MITWFLFFRPDEGDGLCCLLMKLCLVLILMDFSLSVLSCIQHIIVIYIFYVSMSGVISFGVFAISFFFVF